MKLSHQQNIQFWIGLLLVVSTINCAQSVGSVPPKPKPLVHDESLGEVDPPSASKSKSQLLLDELEEKQFKQEYGPDSLKDLRTIDEEMAGKVQPVPSCTKVCKREEEIEDVPSLSAPGGNCVFKCPKVPAPPPLPDTDIQFRLFTSQHPTLNQPLKVDLRQDFSNVKLIPGADTVIICHGFMSGPEKGPGGALKGEYLKLYKSNPINIILVDWSPAAKLWLPRKLEKLRKIYFPPAMNVQNVGWLTKIMIRKIMARANITLPQIHLIGHSLGAQAMGYAGKYLALDSDMADSRKVGRITALDPAAPCFEKDSWHSRYCFEKYGILQPISKEDAVFVDVIHSNAAVLGMTDPVGHVDFYPNGGAWQPGCSGILPTCSHSRAIGLMAASINGKSADFHAAKCSSKDEAIKKACKLSGKFNILGQFVHTDSGSNGIYYLPTTTASPFKSHWA